MSHSISCSWIRWSLALCIIHVGSSLTRTRRLWSARYSDWSTSTRVKKQSGRFLRLLLRKEPRRKWTTEERNRPGWKKSEQTLNADGLAAAAGVCWRPSGEAAGDWYHRYVRSDTPEWGGSNWPTAEIYENITEGWKTAVSRLWKKRGS